MSTSAAHHLSPAFPERAAWGTAPKLRAWQEAALTAYLERSAAGERDFLTVATHYGTVEDAPAVLGVVSGSWSDELAARIPTECRVVVRVHRDEAGAKYREAICRSLSGRCRVFAEAGEVAHV